MKNKLTIIVLVLWLGFVFLSGFMTVKYMNLNQEIKTNEREQQEKEQEELGFRREAKSLLLKLIDELPFQEEEFENNAEDIRGEASIIGVDINSSINQIVFAEDDAIVTLEIHLDESSRTEMNYWSIDIYFVDFEQNLEIYISYYHYDEFLREDFYNETWKGNYMTLVNLLGYLTIEDYRDIMNDLGYVEVSNENRN